MPIRVAYLCEFPTLLGGERSLLTFLGHRRRADVEAVVVAPAGGPLAEALAELGVVRTEWPPGGKQAPDRLAKLLSRLHVDLVHANALMTARCAGTLAESLNVPAVAHVRDIITLSNAHRQELARLSALIAVSDAVADWLRSQGLPADRVTRVYNAVDADAIRKAARPGSLRTELGLSDNARIIGCIGQIAIRKGQDVFLEAAAQVAAVAPESHFVAVGERYSRKAESRDFERDLHERACTGPLKGRVHFLGYRADVPAILADFDVLVVPSRQEPLSRTLLEGLALGVPVVATAVGGSPEILAAGRFGLLVPPDHPAAMADGVRKLLYNTALRSELQRLGPERIAEAFTPEQYSAQIAKVYTRVLSDARHK